MTVYWIKGRLVTGHRTVRGHFQRGQPATKQSVLDLQVSTGVDALAKILARFEVRNVFAGQRNSLAGLRVAADTRWPEMQRKAAEASNLYSLSPGQGVAHQVQQVLDGQLNVFRRQMLLLPGEDFNEF